MFSAANQFVWTAAVNSCLFVKQLPVLLERTMNSKALQFGAQNSEGFVVPTHFTDVKLVSAAVICGKRTEKI
jgi:hypothetical protein